jgi:regulatory protein
MAVITGIVETPRRPGRFELLVDGRPVATLSLDIVERLRLRVGDALSDARRGAVEEAAAELRTFDRALNLLAFRPRSSRELKRQLVRKGEPEAFAETAVARLTASGLLDDAEFARQFARSRVVGKGMSKRRLEQELYRKGVERETATEAIGEVLADEEVDEAGMLERLARKKARTLSALSPEVRRRRLYAFLARRGHESDAIRRAIDSALEPADGEESGLDTDADGQTLFGDEGSED